MERRNPSIALGWSIRSQATSRKQQKERIESKANALGNTKDMSRGLSMTWNVESQLAMNMTKAERNFRMVWKDDIPVYAGVEPNLEWKEIPAEVTGKACFQVAKTNL